MIKIFLKVSWCMDLRIYEDSRFLPLSCPEWQPTTTTMWLFTCKLIRIKQKGRFGSSSPDFLSSSKQPRVLATAGFHRQCRGRTSPSSHRAVQDSTASSANPGKMRKSNQVITEVLNSHWVSCAG